MDDTGEFSASFQLVRLIAIALCHKTVASCRFEYVFGVRAVTGNAAIRADLLKRYPFSVIRQDHRKRCRAAFERFHLHHNGNLSNTPLDGCFYFVFGLSHILHLSSR